MTSIYIFDLDGTIADIEHRRHLVHGSNPDWTGFYRSCINDKPNCPVIHTLEKLAPDHRIWVWSGRSDTVRAETLDWLKLYTQAGSIDKVLMRRNGDATPDQDLKRSWYDALTQSDRDQIVAVFDDRQKVVDMWRSTGVACFQVAPGDF